MGRESDYASLQEGSVTPSAAGDPSGPRDEPPKQIGRYEIREQIGAGGMGVVYGAFDPELERKVALKLLSTQRHSAAYRDRLLREGKALAKLSHPNVVAVFDVGSLEDEVYLVMELIEGQTLKEWLERDHSISIILRVFRDAARGLVAAHENGVIHRDFKPANVLVGDDGRVRVLDFGLARGLPDKEELDVSDEPEPSSLSSSLTQTGRLVGTPKYMAPEQYRRAPADALSDQYAFCITLFEAVYRTYPFAGQTAEEIAMAKIGEKVDVPRGRGVPRWLHSLIMRGLRVEPRRRFASMEALLTALAGGLRRRRRRLAIGAALVVGAGFVTWHYASSPDLGGLCERPEQAMVAIWDPQVESQVRDAFLAVDKPFALSSWAAVKPELDRYSNRWIELRHQACEQTLVQQSQSVDVMSRRMACLDRQLHQFGGLTALLAVADAGVVERAMEAVEALEPLERCFEGGRLAAREPLDEPMGEELLTIRAELARTHILYKAGKMREALDVANTALTRARELQHPATEAAALRVLGDVHGAFQDGPAAEQAYTGALEVARSIADDDNAARALIGLVNSVGTVQARYDEAEELALQADALLKERGLEDELDAGLAQARGVMLHEQARDDEAIPFLERSLELYEKLHGRVHARVASAHNSLGGVYLEKNDYEAALRHYERSLAIWQEVRGSSHSSLASPLSNIGIVLNHQGKYGESLAMHEEALSLIEETYGKDHPWFGHILMSIGYVHAQQGEDVKAEHYYRRALGLRERARPREVAGVGDDAWGEARNPVHPDVAAYRTYLGTALRAQGKFDDSIKELRQALTIREDALGPEHPLVARSLQHLAGVLMCKDLHDEAQASYKRALQIHERDHGPEHTDTAVAIQNLAASLHDQGRNDEARAYFQRALAIWEQSLGPDHPRLSWPLAALGDLELDVGRPLHAIEPLERALALEQDGDQPAHLATTRFSLARALWSATTERARAVDLAQLARNALADGAEGLRAGDDQTPCGPDPRRAQLEEIDAWLRARTR